MANIAEEIRKCAETLIRIADSLADKKEPPADKAEETVAAKELTIEDVRKVLASLSVAGHGLAVKQLIESFGADKLSEIPPEQFADLLKEAEKIGN